MARCCLKLSFESRTSYISYGPIQRLQSAFAFGRGPNSYCTSSTNVWTHPKELIQLRYGVWCQNDTDCSIMYSSIVDMDCAELYCTADSRFAKSRLNDGSEIWDEVSGISFDFWIACHSLDIPTVVEVSVIIIWLKCSTVATARES